MILRNTYDAADAGNIDDCTLKERRVLRTFRKEVQECGGDKEDRERIDTVERVPFLERFVVKESSTERSWVFVLRCGSVI